ncbi:23S rRNA (cytidine(2498)-2'-O)-methyltransferase RlmM [Halomonas sp. Bachu 37]|uniref:23S rRNA (cytidine(2498)-2'-O)-methyltransferase RlmM n=1 Tax=Halomonas kashgarensis TaxID=3084920 RepID=UPI003216EE3E
MSVELVPNAWLVYCRAGFETDAAEELSHRAKSIGIKGNCVTGAGWARLELPAGEAVNDLHHHVPFASLVFARQSLVALPPLALSREDRLSSIIEQVRASGWSFETVWHETPDTNEGNALSRLGKSLDRPLTTALKKKGALRRKAGGRRLHLLWCAGDQVQIAMSFPGNRSELPGGIRRLRFPSRAPSRSTLKLEEAWHEFVPREEWDVRLAEHMQAADLGAAPGGWTWQLVQRGMYVYAIDNGPMEKSLMQSGQVDHLREDGFTWEPPQRLDWLVCDIVDKPARVLAMVERWLVRKWCHEAVFNLKLPMKQRWQEVSKRLAQLEEALEDAGVKGQVRCRHLYHDREEVTVHVRLRG